MKHRSRSRSRSPRLIPPLKKGELRLFGYSIKLPADERRIALQRAVHAYPVVSVMRKLNALYVLQKNMYPENALKFKADEKWLKSNFYVAKSPSPPVGGRKVRRSLKKPKKSMSRKLKRTRKSRSPLRFKTIMM